MARSPRWAWWAAVVGPLLVGVAGAALALIMRAVGGARRLEQRGEGLRGLLTALLCRRAGDDRLAEAEPCRVGVAGQRSEQRREGRAQSIDPLGLGLEGDERRPRQTVDPVAVGDGEAVVFTVEELVEGLA